MRTYSSGSGRPSAKIREDDRGRRGCGGCERDKMGEREPGTWGASGDDGKTDGGQRKRRGSSCWEMAGKRRDRQGERTEEPDAEESELRQRTTTEPTSAPNSDHQSPGLTLFHCHFIIALHSHYPVFQYCIPKQAQRRSDRADPHSDPLSRAHQAWSMRIPGPTDQNIIYVHITHAFFHFLSFLLLLPFLFDYICNSFTVDFSAELP